MKRRLGARHAGECPLQAKAERADRRRRRTDDRHEAGNGFVRGFVAAGVLAAVQARRPGHKEILRLALQSGTAMATGIASANALERGDYASALLAVAAGAAGLSAINLLLPEQSPSTKEVSDEQKKA